MTFITVLYSNSYYCLRNILLLKFTLLGITLIIVLAHQSYMGARGSCRYFLRENQNKCADIQSVVSNATKHYNLTSSDIDYYMLGTLLCNNLPRKKIRLLESFLNETLLRSQQKKPLFVSHRGIRRCYTKGTKSIYMNMPVPLAIDGGEAFGNFAIVSVENAVNHLLGHDITLKRLKFNKPSDWKNSTECFYTLFHKELHGKLQKVEHLPETLRIHLLYIWSDGFQKNTLVKTKKHLCNSLLFMLCHWMVYKTFQDTLFLLHSVKNKVITNPNLSKFYGRRRDWNKLHPDFARILILVNQSGLKEL